MKDDKDENRNKCSILGLPLDHTPFPTAWIGNLSPWCGFGRWTEVEMCHGP